MIQPQPQPQPPAAPEPGATANARHTCPSETYMKVDGSRNTHTPTTKYEYRGWGAEGTTGRGPIWYHKWDVKCRDCVFIFIAEGGAACIYPIFSPPMDWWIGDRPVSTRRLRNPRQRQCADIYLCWPLILSSPQLTPNPSFFACSLLLRSLFCSFWLIYSFLLRYNCNQTSTQKRKAQPYINFSSINIRDSLSNMVSVKFWNEIK